MSVELKNWKELCKEKDERIKELEGKFDLIVERLEKQQQELPLKEWKIINEAIEIVKKVGGMND